MRQSRPVGRSPAGSSLAGEIAHLRDLDLAGLRARWRSVMGREAPGHLSRQLMFAMLAYRIQADIHGDLDPQTSRLLKALGADRHDGAAERLTDIFDQGRREPAPGTVLSREWNGQRHRVTVVSGGFSWEGRTYNSLSQIASAITGTRWNGPRFFGLRDRQMPEAAP